MARIAGVDLPREKRIEVGLTYVYGIGQSTADEILAGTGIDQCAYPQRSEAHRREQEEVRRN